MEKIPYPVDDDWGFVGTMRRDWQEFDPEIEEWQLENVWHIACHEVSKYFSITSPALSAILLRSRWGRHIADQLFGYLIDLDDPEDIALAIRKVLSLQTRHGTPFWRKAYLEIKNAYMHEEVEYEES